MEALFQFHVPYLIEADELIEVRVYIDDEGLLQAQLATHGMVAVEPEIAYDGQVVEQV